MKQEAAAFGTRFDAREVPFYGAMESAQYYAFRARQSKIWFPVGITAAPETSVSPNRSSRFHIQL
jgi:hypothetical protein